MATRFIARIAGVVLSACVAWAGPGDGPGHIKITYTDPLSGPFAQVGDQNLKQFKYIIDYINSRGGALAGSSSWCRSTTSRSRPMR